jgi:hypothetical protein
MRGKFLISFAAVMMLAGAGVASLLTADTLRLRNGNWVEGTYAGGNSSSIRFNVYGVTRTYSIDEVEEIQFGDAAQGTRYRMVPFENDLLSMNRPDNWQVTQNGDSWTIAPSNGRVRDADGGQSLAYGVTIDIFDAYQSPYSQQLQSRRGYGLRGTLRDDTDVLIEDLRQSNRNLRVMGATQNIRVSGRPALSMRLSNDSPLGGLETNWLVTAEHPDGLVYVIFTAPEREFRDYDPLFQQMLSSIRLRQ